MEVTATQVLPAAWTKDKQVPSLAEGETSWWTELPSPTFSPGSSDKPYTKAWCLSLYLKQVTTST